MPRRGRRRRPSRRRFPWQQNFLRVPQRVIQKLKSLPDIVLVAVGVRIRESAIKEGMFEHIGITWASDAPTFEEEVLPRPDIGKWSATNAHGREVVHRDLPMTTKSWDVETPNWGDWYRGSHTVTFDKKVYQRDRIPPRQLAIKISLIGEEPGPDRLYVFKFGVDEVLDRKSADFEQRLFYNLNLLQENVGHADVFSSEASLADYLGTLYVSWEILPPGERESNIAIILKGIRGLTEEKRRQLVDRYDFLARLRPRNFVAGTSGFRRYFGAQFEDDLVVFENVEYGNAIYVMGESWERLSQLSRTELLAMAQREDFTRILHTTAWKQRLREEIKKRRRKR